MRPTQFEQIDARLAIVEEGIKSIAGSVERLEHYANNIDVGFLDVFKALQDVIKKMPEKVMTIPALDSGIDDPIIEPATKAKKTYNCINGRHRWQDNELDFVRACLAADDDHKTIAEKVFKKFKFKVTEQAIRRVSEKRNLI